MVNFLELQRRLTSLLKERIHSGELTERGLARVTGVSQPHIHNVLKGKRLFSIATADMVLRSLNLDILDLLREDDVVEWPRRH